ncbi:MAG: dephospho-CoA kinase [Myxococcota bacterium]
MDVYGLTGGIGSGKSTVASMLEDFGIPVVSADELSRIVVAAGSEGLAEVAAAFGDDVLDDAGELDRRKMASIVFREPARRQQLEAILHPRIRERFEQVLDALEKAGHNVTVYEVPLLFEKNLQADMKATILVTATESTRIRRVMERDDVTETEVKARIATQMPEALKRKRADYIVENNGDPDALRREVRFLLERFLRVDARTTLDQARVTPTPEPAGAALSGGTVVAPAPSRTPTQVPSHAPTLPPAPSSVGTMPGIPTPPEEPASAAPPTPPPGVKVPTPVPTSAAPPPPKPAAGTPPIPTPNASVPKPAAAVPKPAASVPAPAAAVPRPAASVPPPAAAVPKPAASVPAPLKPAASIPAPPLDAPPPPAASIPAPPLDAPPPPRKTELSIPVDAIKRAKKSAKPDEDAG